MKLRVKGSSLRLRLTQSEVRQLGSGAEVTEQVQFAPGVQLVYRLRSDAARSAITAAYRDNVIDIRIPQSTATTWCDTHQVTLSHTQAFAGGELRIVIEKDYACLAPREAEDESDNFPHPDAGKD